MNRLALHRQTLAAKAAQAWEQTDLTSMPYPNPMPDCSRTSWWA